MEEEAEQGREMIMHRAAAADDDLSEASDSARSSLSPPSALQQKLDEMFHEEDPVQFMSNEGVTLTQVRAFLKDNKLRSAQYYAGLKISSSGGYPLHEFVATSEFLKQKNHKVTAEWLGLISDLIRAFPQALLSQDKKKRLPLHLCAVKHNNGNLCRLLLDFCPAACMVRATMKNDSCFKGFEFLPLQAAIEYENWNVASILLDQTIKCGVDLLQEEYPLIEHAIDSNPNLHFLEELLCKVPGSSRIKTFSEGKLPLVHAITTPHCPIMVPEILRVLIDDFPDALKIPDDESGDLPIHIIPFCFAGSDDVDYPAAVQLLIDRYPEGLSCPNECGELPLHVLVHCFADTYDGGGTQIMQVLRLMSEGYQEAHMVCDNAGNLPLHLASVFYHRNLYFRRFLVEQNDQALQTRNLKGNLPLHLALENTERGGGHFGATILVEAFPGGLREEDASGNLPLHLALMLDRQYSLEFIQYLLDRYPEAVRHANAKSSLPLHVLCSNPRASHAFIVLLTEAFPEAVHLEDASGSLPLHRALKENDVFHSTESIQYLLDLYPEAVLHANAEGCQPLHVLCSNLYAKSAFIDLLAAVFPEGLQSVDHAGNLPLHRALKTGINTNRFHSTQFIQNLLDLYPGATGRANAKGFLPLHTVCSTAGAPFALIEVLAQHDHQGLAMFDHDGLLPFHHLCVRDAKEDGALVFQMLETWFDGQSLPSTEDGTHALFFACEKNSSLDVIKLLAGKSIRLFETFAKKAKLSKKKSGKK